jgi:hypothetical protein
MADANEEIAGSDHPGKAGAQRPEAIVTPVSAAGKTPSRASRLGSSATHNGGANIGVSNGKAHDNTATGARPSSGDQAPRGQPSIRPFFLPPDIVIENLPHNLQLAIAEIVVPAYEQLVLGADNPLAKSIGCTLVWSLTLEILDQCQMGADLFSSGLAHPPDREQLDKRMAAHFRIADAKLRAAGHLNRLAALQLLERKLETLEDA